MMVIINCIKIIRLGEFNISLLTQDCPPNLVFNPDENRCDDVANVPDCDPNHSFICPSADGYFSDPLSCSSYYLCVDNSPILLVICCLLNRSMRTLHFFQLLIKNSSALRVWSLIQTRANAINQKMCPVATNPKIRYNYGWLMAKKWMRI